jgi:hypothetical protein
MAKRCFLSSGLASLFIIAAIVAPVGDCSEAMTRDCFEMISSVRFRGVAPHYRSPYAETPGAHCDFNSHPEELATAVIDLAEYMSIEAKRTHERSCGEKARGSLAAAERPRRAHQETPSRAPLIAHFPRSAWPSRGTV